MTKPTSSFMGFLRRAVFAALTASLAFASTLAQGHKVTVVGAVTDATGAVIAGVQVRLTRADTNDSFETQTNEKGHYAIPGLAVGRYQLEASKIGFKTERRSDLRLHLGQTYRYDLRLSVGEMVQVVDVPSITPLLKTETAELGQVIINKPITRLPLNGRNLFDLGPVTPGIQRTRSAVSPILNLINYNVRGMRQSDNYAMLDGGQVSQTAGAVQFFVNPDAIEEFEVKSGLYGAEYGIKSGGQFNVITKSGTNRLHGTFHWFHRNDNLDARNFFDPGPRPEFKLNNFGAVAGGPIYLPQLFDGKDRAWWFLSYSGERVRQLQSLTGITPTAEQKSGQFAGPITDPATGASFPNHRIPQERFDPVAVKLMQFWPSPNADITRGFNYVSASNAARYKNEWIARIDLKTGENSRWSGRFLWSELPRILVNPIDSLTAVDPITNWSQNVTNTRSFGTRVLNEFGLHWYRRLEFAGDPPGGPEGFGPTLGLPGWPNRAVDIDGVPRTVVTGFLPLASRFIVGPIPDGQWEVKDKISWTRGSHLFTAGYHYRYHHLSLGTEARSSFTFTNDRFTGNSFANFLLGHLTASSEGSEIRSNTHFPSHHFYFQDSWRASGRLTLNLGLRYELRLG